MRTAVVCVLEADDLQQNLLVFLLRERFLSFTVYPIIKKEGKFTTVPYELA